MRIGEILLEHQWIDWETFALAIGDQPRSGLRLCSLLISRGALAFDDAARALGEQHGVAAVTKRHLAHRDRELVGLLPWDVARKAIALPIGRKGDGTLIVCVRDPSPQLDGLLSRTIGEPILMAVAPARILERLVAQVYPPEELLEVEPEPEDDFDLDVELDAGDSGSHDVDLSDPEPSVAASKPSRSKPLPVTIRPITSNKTSRPAGNTLEVTLAALQDIDDAGWLFDTVMTYVTARWTSAVLLTIKGAKAIGLRGHGPKLPKVVRLFEIEMDQPSIVKDAHQLRRLHDDVPEPSDTQSALSYALGEPRRPMAAPLLLGDEVTHVLVVGDPHGDDVEDALVDLARLIEGIDEARARIEKTAPQAPPSE